MWSGRLSEAEAAFRSLLDREHDPSVEAQARILLSRTLATQGPARWSSSTRRSGWPTGATSGTATATRST
jgi:hypothetical protein